MSKIKKYNKMLPRKQKKYTLTTPQKVAFSIMSVAMVVSVTPTIYTAIYNYINRADTTEIKTSQKEDLLPTISDEDNQQLEERAQQQKQDKQTSFSYMKDFLRKQIEEKLTFSIEGDFEILGVFEQNLQSDGFESTNTKLNILIKPQNGNVFCVSYNNKYATLEIENSNIESDVISSFVAHLQQSSIADIAIMSESMSDVLYNSSDKSIVFVGSAQTYTEKSGEQSYSVAIFRKDGEKYNMTTYKNLQSEIDKTELDIETVIMLKIAEIGEDILIEYTNSKQADLTALNTIFEKMRSGEKEEENSNKDLLPDDEFAIDAQDTTNQLLGE